MLTRDGIIARFILAFCCFFISGTEMIKGWPATVSGILGCVELSTALLRYSPLYELLHINASTGSGTGIYGIDSKKSRNPKLK